MQRMLTTKTQSRCKTSPMQMSSPYKKPMWEKQTISLKSKMLKSKSQKTKKY